MDAVVYFLDHKNVHVHFVKNHRSLSGELSLTIHRILHVHQPSLGADIIECDVGVTKDKELVCLHDAYLSKTTNVASISKFNGRKQWRTYEGVRYNDWWVVDFTLAELKERVLVSKMVFKKMLSQRPLEGNQIDSR